MSKPFVNYLIGTSEPLGAYSVNGIEEAVPIYRPCRT